MMQTHLCMSKFYKKSSVYFYYLFLISYYPVVVLCTYLCHTVQRLLMLARK